MNEENKHENQEEKLLDHDYDGIRELDNRLPPWWLKLFYLTIVFAVGYMLYYHILGIGDLSTAEYMKTINPQWDEQQDPTYRPMLIIKTYHSPLYRAGTEITPRRLAENEGIELFPTTQPAEDEDEGIDYELLTDRASLSEGQKIFLENCSRCHGASGEGGIGPNLTDEYWIHGNGDINAVIKTIRNGVPIKGMIAWKRYLPPEKIHKVGSYVLSLQGSNPPNAKAPEGNRVTGD
jgi:cytochrome c oxidase cbb3-type subunit 3